MVNFFCDGDLLFPSVWTLRYTECEEDPDGSRSWLFEDPPDFSGGEEPGDDDDPGVTGFSDDQLYQILDFAGLIKVLGEVAVDHPIHPLPGPHSRAATTTQFDALGHAIAKFLESDEYRSLTVTILFTDDGLSLGRREGGFEIGFFAHPRRDPDEEVKIRALFASLGTAPHVDYLSDGGRTRILEFSVPENLETILGLCERVFREVYAMREYDTFKYDFLSRSGLDRMLSRSE
jgi:hypothetical protein